MQDPREQPQGQVWEWLKAIEAIKLQQLWVKGLDPGRMTCVKGLTVAGVRVVSITDHTPLKELGPRPRKIRKV
ncbi:hypothetical protein OSTOST_02913 [Ostertagia ostertagi]